jgi:hypothetical protein
MFISSRAPIRHDAGIVGARRASATTALLLAWQGLIDFAIDRQPCRSDALSTHALMRGRSCCWRDRAYFPNSSPPVRRRCDQGCSTSGKPARGLDALITRGGRALVG